MAKEIILVVDTETTGLNPRRHEIIDLWCVALDRKLNVLWQAGGLVTPMDIEGASPKALEINRYDAETWEREGARPLGKVWDLVVGQYQTDDQVTIAGHNVGFDKAFIEDGLARVGLPALCWWSYRTIDTASLAMHDKRAGRIADRSLATLAGYYIPFGVVQAHWPHNRRHGAKSDARITAAVLRSQMLPYQEWNRAFEESLWPDEDPAPAPSPWPFLDF